LVKTSKTYLKTVFKSFPNFRLNNTIHIWLINIEEISVPELYEILNFKETNRANLYKFKKDRNKYIFRRGILRLLISLYLNCKPDEIKFSEKEGKLSVIFPDKNINFNISYSESKILIAFSNKSEIGVDIEYIRPIEYIDEMGRRLFDKRDLIKFYNYPEEYKIYIYISHWTLSEAYFKIIGKKLSKLKIFDDLYCNTLDIIENKVYFITEYKKIYDLLYINYLIDNEYFISIFYNR
jgi:4'-phosphopantetheinyl transferase